MSDKDQIVSVGMKWHCREALLVAIVVMVMFVGMWYRVTWGGLIPDECYTWLQCLRFEHGDAPFVYEWSTHVTTSFLLWPIYKIYCGLGMDNDGMLIFTRRGFVFVWLVYLFSIYYRLRCINRIGACLGVLAIAFLPPRYSFNLSYNSIAFMGVSFAGVVYIVPSVWRKTELFISGMLLAMACVCIPHLFMLCLVFVVCAFYKDRYALIWMLSGMVLTGIIYACFLLSIVSFSDIIKALPFIVGDPEHTRGGLLRQLLALVRALGGCMGLSVFGIGFLALTIVAVADQKSRHHFLVYWWCGVVVAVGALLYYAFFKSANALNTLSCSIAYLGGLAILASRENSLRPFLWFGIVPAFLFAIIFCTASNTGTLAAAVGLEVAVVPCVVAMFVLPNRMHWCRQAYGCYTAGLLLILSCYIFNEFAVASYRDFPDDSIPMQDGPLRGLYSPKVDLPKRQKIIEDIRTVTADDRIRNVLIIERFGVWQNLIVDKGMSAPWCWCRPVDRNMMDSLCSYWEWHPEKEPDLVFVIKVQRDAFAKVFSDYAQKNGYRSRVLPSGNEIYFRL